MSDNKDTQNDDVEFSQDELEELKKQGIDDAELDKIVKTVHDELSDNANEKSDDKDKEAKVDNHDTPNKDNQEDATAQTDNDTKVITSKTSKEASNPQKNDTKPDNLRQDRPTNIPISHQSTDNKKHDDLKNNAPAADEEAQKIEQQQADIVRMLIAKKHSQKTIDHKEVRINIEAGALPTKIFFMMNGLSAVIAGYGLLANSPAVVIGAMLVAMMLSPITSVALAVIDARLSLLKTSLITLIGGVFVIYVIGMGLGFLHGDNVMTAEILARTSPDDHGFDGGVGRRCGRSLCHGVTKPIGGGGWRGGSNCSCSAFGSQWHFAGIWSSVIGLGSIFVGLDQHACHSVYQRFGAVVCRVSQNS